jgi:predicted metal-dependent peptidase
MAKSKPRAVAPAAQSAVAADPSLQARRAMTAARTALILDQPFFGALSLRLTLTEDPSCQTAWTDGRSLGYSVDYVLNLTHAQRIGLVAHEVMHCAAGHCWRRDGRDPKSWNIAADYAIDPIISAAKFDVPDATINPDWIGKSAEWIHARLPPPDPGDQGSGGSGGSFGEVRDAPKDQPSQSRDQNGSDVQQQAPTPTEADWRQAVQQAATAAQMAGKLPAGCKRFAKAAAQSRVDWRSALRRFCQQVTNADYTWTRPNVRYLSSGLYLPTLHSEQCGPIALYIDCSGSVDDISIGQMLSEVDAIRAELRPSALLVASFDTHVYNAQTFTAEDDVMSYSVKGGGGTDFRPIAEHVTDDQSWDVLPVAVVVLTDMAGRFPDSAPDVPWFWASTSPGATAPFGEVVEMLS